MESVLGSSLPVFIGLTLVLFGGCGFLTGQALAEGWKPAGMVFAYSLLMGLGDRFLVFGLFGGPLLHLPGFIVHTLAILAITMVSYRMALAHRMVSQYPWLYERSGPFGWKEKIGARIAG